MEYIASNEMGSCSWILRKIDLGMKGIWFFHGRVPRFIWSEWGGP